MRVRGCSRLPVPPARITPFIARILVSRAPGTLSNLQGLRRHPLPRVAASVGPVRRARTQIENAMTSVKRVSGLLALAAFVLPAFACSPVTRSNEETYRPPPSLALVAIVDPSQGRLPAQLRQLQDVIKSGATPNEAVV